MSTQENKDLIRRYLEAVDENHTKITMQVAEDDLVVSRIIGRGVHEGELLGIPVTNREVETDGMDVARLPQQLG